MRYDSELLDDDWDFSSGSVGGYLDGSDAETIERRFYKRNETAEVLPWDFYGDLAATDGDWLFDFFLAEGLASPISEWGWSSVKVLA